MQETNYNAKEEWTKEILEMRMAYPAEYVIRIFRGKYPRLNISENDFSGRKILDSGCGDGRNLLFFNDCGFDLYGTEITKEIVDKVRLNLDKMGVKKSAIEVGSNDHIPFNDGFFDYMLSWNACYYMGDNEDIAVYVNEFARVLKPAGYLVMSIPKKTCFIYEGSEVQKPGYRIIRNDPFMIRNGEVLRMFEDENDIVRTFGEHFEDFTFGSDHDDCFGYAYHWHLVVCRLKT